MFTYNGEPHGLAQPRQHEVLDRPHGRVLRSLPARQAAAGVDGQGRAVPREGHARRRAAVQEARSTPAPRPSWQGRRHVMAAGLETCRPQRNVAHASVPRFRVVASTVSIPSMPLPAYQTAGAAGFDLASSVDMIVEPGEVALVPTGLVIEVPAGHFLGIFARSSTPLKRGLMVANGVGVVDSRLLRADRRDQDRGPQLHGGAGRRHARRSARAGRDPAVRARGVGRSASRTRHARRVRRDGIKLAVRSHKLEVQRITRAPTSSLASDFQLDPSAHLTRVTYTANPPGVFAGTTSSRARGGPRVTVRPDDDAERRADDGVAQPVGVSRTRDQPTKPPTA